MKHSPRPRTGLGRKAAARKGTAARSGTVGRKGATARRGTATSRTGQATVKRIIRAARQLLITRGHAEFSMRNVAAKAGLHLANVQYYFPRRSDLVHALLIDTGERYRATFASCLAAAPPDPVERFRAIMRWNLQDIATRATQRFFIQLWTLLMAVDRHSGRLLDECYATDITLLSERIAEMQPGLPATEVRRRATLIASLIEGLTVVRGSHGADEPEMARILERAVALGVQIASGPSPEANVADSFEGRARRKRTARDHR